MKPQVPNQPNYFPPPEQCSGQPLISMQEIVKTFKNAAGEFTALRGVTACFYQGEFVSVVGKSGSGKSTLVNMITGIDHPTSGTVKINDTYVHSLSENDMSIWRGKNLGIVFQFFQLLPTLTLLENVMLPMALAGIATPSGREAKALSLLKRVGLENLADKLPAAVSGGQQQSAAIARALANDPPILIADEPTGNLDSHTADEVFDLFAGLIDQGKSILMVTHDIGLAGRTTRTLLISDGELINPWVARTFNRLDHAQLLWLTHHLLPQTIPTGARFQTASSTDGWLHLVTAGCLEVLAGSPEEYGGNIASLEAGQYVSALDLRTADLPAIGLQAAEGEPLELLSVTGPEAQRWLAEAPVQAGLMHDTSWLKTPEREGQR